MSSPARLPDGTFRILYAIIAWRQVKAAERCPGPRARLLGDEAFVQRTDSVITPIH
jgi:hypothetical protein